MAVTESNLNPKVRKKPHNVLMTVRKFINNIN